MACLLLTWPSSFENVHAGKNHTWNSGLRNTSQTSTWTVSPSRRASSPVSSKSTYIQKSKLKVTVNQSVSVLLHMFQPPRADQMYESDGQSQCPASHPHIHRNHGDVHRTIMYKLYKSRGSFTVRVRNMIQGLEGGRKCTSRRSMMVRCAVLKSASRGGDTTPDSLLWPHTVTLIYTQPQRSQNPACWSEEALVVPASCVQNLRSSGRPKKVRDFHSMSQCERDTQWTPGIAVGFLFIGSAARPSDPDHCLTKVCSDNSKRRYTSGYSLMAKEGVRCNDAYQDVMRC